MGINDRRRVLLVDIAFLFLSFGFAGAWCWQASERLGATFDEPTYLQQGLERYRSNSYRGLLRLGTMPLPMDLHLAPIVWWERNTGKTFDVDVDGRWMLTWARRANLVFVAILFLFGFLLARKWGGSMASRCCVILLAMEPTLLGHGGLATADIAVSAMLVLFVYVVGEFKTFRWPIRVVLPGICLGLAILAKASALVMGPLIFALISIHQNWGSIRVWPTKGEGLWSLLQRWRKESARFRWDLLAMFLVGLGWTFLYCGSDWKEETTFVRWAQGLPAGRKHDAFVWLSEHLKIFPNAGNALARQISHNIRGHGAYILGRTFPRAVWYYFPLCLAMKIGLLTSLAGLVSAGAITRRRINPMLFVSILLLAWSVTFRVQIGVRLILPVLVLLIVGIAIELGRLRIQGWLFSRPLTRVFLFIGLAMSAWDLSNNWPDAVAYFHPAWGGKEVRPKLLSDSNLDWGQGLPELKEWCERNPGEPIYVWYFGADAMIQDEAFRYEPLHLLKLNRPSDLEPIVKGKRWALSLTHLFGTYTTGSLPVVAEYFRGIEPTDRTTTFWIYDFRTNRKNGSIQD